MQWLEWETEIYRCFKNNYIYRCDLTELEGLGPKPVLHTIWLTHKNFKVVYIDKNYKFIR